jgi:hypothetical protein
MFSDRVAHSRFHHLLPIPTLWLTCVCPGPGGGRKSLATRTWINSFFPLIVTAE